MRSIWQEVSPTGRGPPSIGFPRASTTRPSRASPASIEAIRPVFLAPSPAFRLSPPVSRTTPILSAWRSKTIPRLSPPRSISSLSFASRRPATCTMPSPTERTFPSSETPTANRLAFAAPRMRAKMRSSSCSIQGLSFSLALRAVNCPRREES